MKKSIYFLGMIGLVIGLSSCSFTFGQTSQESADVVEKDVTTYEIQNMITDIYEKVNSACIGVYTSISQTAYSTGSGVVYKEENGYYYAITNEHVINGGQYYRVYLGNAKYYSATLIGYDATNDLAVLKFSTDILGGVDITPIDISEVDIVKPGQTTIAIGCPLGLENFNHISTGVVTGINQKYVQTDAALNSGNSGGGLFNISGRLIGINVSKTSWIYNNDGSMDMDTVVEGFGNAITMKTVRKCIADIEAKQTGVDRPLLGISAATINRYLSDDSMVKLLPATLEQAVVVSTVSNNTNASRAGLMPQDIIYMAGDTPITMLEDLQYVLHTSNIGDIIVLKVYRTVLNKIESIDITVTLM